MTHYHVCPVVDVYTPLASIRYDNYEDSVAALVALSNAFYAHRNRRGTLAIEYAQSATGYGDGEAAFIGPPGLGVLWVRCDSDCISPTWN